MSEKPNRMEKPTVVELKIARKVWDKVFGHVYDVESMDRQRRSEGVHYTVKRSGADDWSCDCKSYIYSTGTVIVQDTKTKKVYKRTCKHIRHCMSKEQMQIKQYYT